MNIMYRDLKNWMKWNCLLLPLALWIGGCGEQKFRTVDTQATSAAPGAFTIPPKVDILLFEDDTGSMAEAYSDISAQLPPFLKDLENKNWNYRFATVPLVNRKNRSLTEILTSKHDPSWGSQWVAPYPGALPGLVDAIIPQYFRTPENYSHFLKLSDIDISLGGSEPALANIDTTLYQRADTTRFLRPDALLAIIVLGNGNDTSGVNMCRSEDGAQVACPPPDSSASVSLTSYKNRIIAKKASPSLVKFYAAVANSRQNFCRGGGSYSGTRYKSIEAALSGNQNFDICTQSVSAVLGSIAANLQAQRINMRTRFLFIDQEPNPDTIQVKKHSGPGIVAIPMDANNGWTYAGYVQNVPAIDSPVAMNISTGFAIELHGSAKLIGDESADITFKPKGFKTN